MVAYLWLAQVVPAGASMEDGFSADQIFGTHTGYTYDDLVVLPGHVSFDSNKVDLSTNLTSNEEENHLAIQAARLTFV